MTPHLQPCPPRRSARFVLKLAMLCGSATCLSVWAAPLAVAIARTPLSLPLYVAQAEGYFEAAGLDLKFTDCNGGHRCLQFVLEGAADVATAYDSPVMFRSFEREDYAVIGTFVTTSADIKLIARPSAGITTPSQLRGKKVGVVPGSSSQFFLDSYLLWHGIDPGSVDLVWLQPDEMAAAMRSGKVAALAAWELIAFDTITAMKGDASVLPDAGIYTLSFNLVAHKRLAGARDAELVKLLRAAARAETFIQSHPIEAQAHPAQAAWCRSAIHRLGLAGSAFPARARSEPGQDIGRRGALGDSRRPCLGQDRPRLSSLHACAAAPRGGLQRRRPATLRTCP